MRMGWVALRAGMLAGTWVGGLAAMGQAVPTATQKVDLSFFGAGTETYTELAQSKNTGVTVGFDVTLRRYFHVKPAIEIRGTYPFKSGDVVGLKDVLIGPKIGKDFGRFHPYVDGFFGRGSLTYEDGGIVVGNFRYDRTTSNIFAGGGGVDVRVTRHFDAKADVQFERWMTPVTDTGYIYPIPVSLGVVYHLDFNGPRRQKKPKGQKAAAAAPGTGPVSGPAAVTAP